MHSGKDTRDCIKFLTNYPETDTFSPQLTTTMRIDYKITTWASFEIDDEHRDSLMRFMEQNPNASAVDILDYCYDDGLHPSPEFIVGSDEELSPEENDNQATLEIFVADEKIFDNGKSN